MLTGDDSIDSWEPLVAVIGPAQAIDFMFMGINDTPAARITLYKHRDTRRYLNIGQDGRTFKRTTGSIYTPISHDEALAWTLN
jgi:hypothetical protein